MFQEANLVLGVRPTGIEIFYIEILQHNCKPRMIRQDAASHARSKYQYVEQALQD